MGVFCFLVFSSLFAVFNIGKTSAATSSNLNFQGRLLNSAGGVVPDGYYNLQFKLYDGGTSGGGAGTGQANAGTNLWTESYYDSNGVTAGNDNRVRVVNGYFSVNLGSQTAFPSTINWDQELWLTMNVGGSTQTATPTYDGEMLGPSNARTKLTAVPYAFQAGTALGVSSNATSTASTNSGNVTIQSGNASGATSNSGNITIDNGTATGTAGTISVGTANSTGVTIGRSGITTTLQGAVAITGGTNYGLLFQNSSGSLATTGAGTSGECLRATTGADPSWGSCSGTGDIVQDGNSFGTAMTIGTNDAYDFNFETGGTTKMTLQAGGNLVVDGADNTLYVDATNNRVGLGTAAPDTTLHVAIGTTAALANNTGYEVIGSVAGTNIVFDTTQIQARNNGSAGTLDINKNGGTFNVGSTTANSVNVNNGQVTVSTTGQAVFKNSTNSTTSFQIQNAAGTNTVFNADTTTNLVTNSGFETNTSGWSVYGGATLTRTTSQFFLGSAALQIDTTAAINDGAKFPVSLSSNTQYTISLVARITSSTFTTFQIGRSDDGSTDTNCGGANQTVLSSGWTRYVCTIQTGTVSGSPYIYVKQNNATARTFYIDDVSLTTRPVVISGSTGGQDVLAVEPPSQASSSTAFISVNGGRARFGYDGTGTGNVLIQGAGGKGINLRVNGLSNNVISVNSSGNTTFQNVTDSTSGFLIQNSSSTNLFRVDTTNSNLYFGGNSVYDATNDRLTIGSSTADTAKLYITTGGVALKVNQTSTNYLLELQKAGVDVVQVAHDGTTLFKNSADGTTAFQVQNSSANTLLNVATSTNTVTLGSGGSSTYASTVNIANTSDGTNTQTVNIGSTANASNSITIQGGTGATALGLQVGAGGTINVGTTGNNVLNLGTGAVAGAITVGGTSQTGTLTLGQSTDTNTISIGSSNSLASGKTQTINIGTSTGAGSTTTLNIGSTIAGVTTLQSAGGVKVSTIGTVTSNSQVVCRDTSTKLLTACDSGAGGAPFIQGGNSFGATAVLGTNDSNSLTFETNNATQATIAVGGATTFKNSADSTSAFQIQNASSVTLFNVDSTGTGRVSVGTNGTATGQLYVSGLAPTAALATLSGVNENGLDSIAMQGRYAYVVSYDDSTVKVFDVSTPSSPTLVSTSSNFLSNPEYIAVQDGYGYVANSNDDTLEVVNISNPNSVTSVTQVSLGAGANPLQVIIGGNYLYVLDSGTNDIKVFNFANPSNPVLVSTFGSANFPRRGYLQGKYLYTVNKTANQMQIIDVSNPASLSSVSTYTPGTPSAMTNPLSIAVSGRYAYIADQGTNLLRVIDVKNPASPSQVGTVASGTDPEDIVVQGRYAYLVSNTSGSLKTFDISTPSSPTLVNSVATGSQPYHLAVQGRYAYVTTYLGDSFEIYDIGGAYLQQLEAGGIEATTLSTRDLSVANNASVAGVLNVGGSAQINGALGVGGAVTLQNTTNTNSAFKVQNASGTSYFGVDTLNQTVSTGTSLTVGSVTGNRIFTDNFESGNLNLWQTQTGSTSVDTATVFSGKYVGKINPTASFAYSERQFNGGAATMYARGYVYIASASTKVTLFSLYNLTDGFGSSELTVYRNAGGNIAIYSGAAAADCLTGGALSTGAWHKIQMKVVLSNTGSCQVTVDDGTPVTSGSVDTLATSNPSRFSFGSHSGAETDVTYFDELAVDTVPLDNTGSLNVQDTLHVGGTSIFSGITLFQPSTTSTSAFQMRDTTGNVYFNADSTQQTLTLGGTSQTGTLTLGQSTDTNTIFIGSGVTATGKTQTITIGTGAATGTAKDIVTIGSTNDASSVTLQAGTGNINFNASNAQFTEVTGTRTINIQTRTTNVAGSNLTVSAGAAGAGASAFSGGTLTLQGGAAGGTGNANGGSVTISGGAGVGTGTQGLVNLSTTAFSSATEQSFSSSTSITAGNVDLYSSLPVKAITNTGLVLTVPDPNQNTVIGRLLYVSARSGSLDFTLRLNSARTPIDITMKANSTATLIWNGTDWTAAGASSSTDLQAAYNNTVSSAGGAELVLNAPGGNADGLTIRNNATTPITGGLLEVQNSIGSNLFSVNNNAAEYATNGGAETAGASSSTFPSTTWDATTGGTVDRYTTTGDNVATGQASVRVQTTASNHGARNRISATLTSGLSYKVSFAVRGATNFSTLEALYSPDGTTTGTTSCASAQTVTSGQWTRVSCSVTASGTITSSNSILIRQTDATARTFYIDNLSITIDASATYAADGSVDNSGSFATNWTNFAASGTATMSRDTSIIYDTGASAAVNLSTATANNGMRNNLAITPQTSTQYLVTFYARSTTTMTGTLAVGFLPAGGTSVPTGTAACTDYNTQTLAANTWTKITCLFTTAATSITNPDLVIYQTDAAIRTINVDALTITLNTNNSNNVQIGGANKGGPATLFTLDRSAGAPIADNNNAYLGSMYYDTTTGRIQCYEADGWGACGAAPDNYVNLNPEYAGAVLNGSGVGTMTADFCANQSGVLQVNYSSASDPCFTSGDVKNYYKWTSPQATQQTYSIYVTYQLPATFNGFSSDDTVQLIARADSTSNAAVTYQMFYRASGAGSLTQCGTGETTVVTSTNTWQSVGINGNEATGCSLNSALANGLIIFKINMKANSNASAYVSTLSFVTTGR